MEQQKQPSNTPLPVEINIFTIPEQFLPGGKGKQPNQSPPSRGGGGRSLIIIGVIAVVLAGITYATFALLNSPLNPFIPKPQEELSTVKPVAPSVPVSTSTTQVQEPSQTVTFEAQARDAQRIADLTMLANALEAYQRRYSVFPQTLNLIPKDILSAEPLDPSLKSPYRYIASPDQKTFEIQFDIEEQATFRGEVLTKATYRMTPERLGIPPLGLEPQIPEPPTQPSMDDLSRDSDGDGLTLGEEKLMKTDPAVRDTDSDGYPDGSEVSNLYSPIQRGSIKLDQEGLVKRYENPTFGYAFWYPALWIVSQVSNDPSDVLITTGTGEDISFQVQDNPTLQTSWEWYAGQVNTEATRDSVNIVTVAGLEAVRTLDGQNVYLVNGTKAYSIRYHKNAEAAVNYPSIFNLILKYLILAKPAV